jgi:hypothetical protein
VRRPPAREALGSGNAFRGGSRAGGVPPRVERAKVSAGPPWGPRPWDMPSPAEQAVAPGSLRASRGRGAPITEGPRSTRIGNVSWV